MTGRHRPVTFHSSTTRRRQGLYCNPRRTILEAVLQTPPAAVAPSSVPLIQAPPRNIAVDAYRGLVMFLMMAEVLQLARVSQAFPGSHFWSFLAYHQTHTDWAGCSLHDTIQPGFSFLVGVALPYSIASRLAKGGAFGTHVRPRPLAVAAAGGAGHLPPLAERPANVLHVRRYAHADRPGLPAPFSAGVSPAEMARHRAGGDPGRLLAGVGALSGARPRFRLPVGRRPDHVAAFLYGFRRALEQERQLRQRLRPVVPQPVPAHPAIRI